MMAATGWWPARRRLAALAVATAMLTAAASVMLGGPGRYGFEVAYVGIAVVATFLPAAITLQVIVGQLLLARLLVEGSGGAALTLVPLMAGIVVTAELLAVVARLDMPLERDPRGVYTEVGLAAVVAGGVFCLVLAVGDLPGPGGLVAICVGSGACVVLATLMPRPRSEPRALQDQGDTLPQGPER